MNLCVISLFCLVAFLYIIPVSSACEAPPDTNFTRPPRYWCSLEARVSITTECDTEVEEIITVPWSSGMLDRIVPTQEDQKIEDLSAFRVSNGERISMYSIIRRNRLPGNVVLGLRVVPTPGPVTISIKYKMKGGVQRFSECSGIGDFKNASSSLENSLMMSKWAVGGRSAAEMRRVMVRFEISRHQRIRYLDTLTTTPDSFKQEINKQNNDTNKPVEVVYSGFAFGLIPSDMFFYVRFMMQFGVQSCPSSRSCEAENHIIQQGKLLRSNHKTILGLTLGLGFAVIVVSIVSWVCCCKWVRERQPDTELDGRLPVSLRHFAYDTGDEHQRKKREEWTEASPKSSQSKEKFFAMDLSPKNRQKKTSNDF